MSYAHPTFIGIFLCNSLLDLKERKMKDKKKCGDVCKYRV